MLFSNQHPVSHLLISVYIQRRAGMGFEWWDWEEMFFMKSSDRSFIHASPIKYDTKIMQACVYPQMHKHLTTLCFCSAFCGSIKKHEVFVAVLKLSSDTFSYLSICHIKSFN